VDEYSKKLKLGAHLKLYFIYVISKLPLSLKHISMGKRGLDEKTEV